MDRRGSPLAGLIFWSAIALWISLLLLMDAVKWLFGWT